MSDRPQPVRWTSPADFEPADDVVDLWCFPLVERPDDAGVLDPDELARAEKLIIESKRRQFIAGRARLRSILAHHYLGQAATDVRFDYGEHGKPSLPGHPELAFNLSHSHELALLGVTRGVRLGVDVEHRRPGRAFAAIAERFFADDEIEVLRAAAPELQPQLFYRAWAQKEAYLKAWGTGLTFSSRGFSVALAPEQPAAVLATTMPNDDPSRWRVRDVVVPGDYAAAVCWENAPRRLRCFEVPA